jgi:TDG/mug DNA glycosylase family protein
LLQPGLKAVVVGINPAPVSVAAGHYWQGKTGKTLWRRLQRVGLMPKKWSGFEDDAAFKVGLGFTDVVKRSTTRADEVSPDELAEGRRILESKLLNANVPLLIFVFKAAAKTLFGRLDGCGFVDRRLGGAEVFVMPGPYPKRVVAGPMAAFIRARAH